MPGLSLWTVTDNQMLQMPEESDGLGLPPGWVAPKDWSICSMVGAMA